MARPDEVKFFIFAKADPVVRGEMACPYVFEQCDNLDQADELIDRLVDQKRFHRRDILCIQGVILEEAG